tara:strand:- start:2917 stop:4050 length:1134 start_codon:yes stop_codon:yes gene_type:complete
MSYNWPSAHKAGTTTTDAATDKISDARSDINQNIVNVNEIIDMFDLASEPSNGQILKYNTTSDRFEVGADAGGIALTDLSVSTASASGAGSLAYNNSTGVFTFTPASPTLAGLSGSINDLTDVDTTGVANNKILKFNSSTSRFEIADDSGSGSGIALTDLSVNVVSASGGGNLAYNNSTGVFTFTPANVSGGSGSGTTRGVYGGLKQLLHPTTPANAPQYEFWQLDEGADQIHITLALPDTWNGSNLKWKVFWTGDAGGGSYSGNFRILSQCLGSNDNESLLIAPGSFVAVTDVFQSENFLHVTPQATITDFGSSRTPGSDSLLHIDYYVDASQSYITSGGTPKILGVKFEWSDGTDDHYIWKPASEFYTTSVDAAE